MESARITNMQHAHRYSETGKPSEGIRRSRCRLGNSIATLQKARQVYAAVVKPAMMYGAAVWHAPSGTTEAKMTHVKELAVEQKGCLRTVLGAYRATPTVVLEAESKTPNIRISLDHAVLRMQALRGTHLVTKMGDAKIRKILCKKKQTKRGSTKKLLVPSRSLSTFYAQNSRQSRTNFWAARVLTPAEEKERWALRSLGIASWSEAERAAPRLPGGGAVNGTSRNRVQLRKKINKWVEEAKQRAWRKYQEGVQAGKKSPAQGGDFKGRLELHTGPKKAESSLVVQMRTGKNWPSGFPAC